MIFSFLVDSYKQISHGHTAHQALEYGDEVLGKICGSISADESRHEIAYTKVCAQQQNAIVD